MAAKPTGARHEVGVHELFFSTTDSRGVIAQANKVFVDIARKARADLIGAPHNIIRHPDMPGGAFRIIWETIGAKVPACAYVENIAGDGSSYWAFATVTPLPGKGYLSVRSRPCNLPMMDRVIALYRQVRAEEREGLQRGVAAGTVARYGQQRIEEELRALGYATYQDFMLHILPAEVDARRKVGGSAPKRPDADGPARTMLDAVTMVEADVSALNRNLHEADLVAGDLDRTVEAVMGDLAVLETALREVRGAIVDHAAKAPMLVGATPAVEAQCAEVGTSLRGVRTRVAEVQARRRQLRFSTALAQMQAECICHFAAAVIDGEEDGETSRNATRSLVTSLEAFVDQVRADLALDRDQLDLLLSTIGAAESPLRIISMLLRRWCQMIGQYGLEEATTDHLPRMTAAVERLVGNLTCLQQTAEAFGAAVLAFRIDGMEAQLHRALTMAETMADYRVAA